MQINMLWNTHAIMTEAVVTLTSSRTGRELAPDSSSKPIASVREVEARKL